MRPLLADPVRRQSRGEEVANSISHAIGLAATLVGTPFLLLQATRSEDADFVVGASLFCVSSILLYLTSTLYHALPRGRAKGIFRLLEHCAIFLLIAGTYSPFTLGVLRGAWGWTLFGVIWGLALVGVALKVFARSFGPVLSTGLYLLMGWLLVIAGEPLLARMHPAGLYWLIGGGLFYTLGVAFFATDARLPYGHLIWHLFVLAGTSCHYFAVLWYAG